MSDFSFVKLESICTRVCSGGTPSTRNKEYYTNGTVPWVKTKEVNNNKVYVTENFITEEALKNSSAKLIEENSIIVAMYGNGDTAGRVAINKIPLATNQACCNFTIDPECADYRFVFYFLRTQYQKLVDLKNGGAQQNLNSGILKEYLVPNPPIEKQRAIADILEGFDDKIQLNNETNATLEQIAQAIFKSWFIDFDPVHAKAHAHQQALAEGKPDSQALHLANVAAMQVISGKTADELAHMEQTQPSDYAQLLTTADAFPSAFDDKGLPLGWEKENIGNIATITKGKSYKSSELNESKTALVTLKSFNRGGGYRLDGLKEYTGKYKPEQEVFSGDLIIAYTDVTQSADVIGKPAMVMSDSRYEHLIISLDVAVVRPNDDIYKYYLYCLANTHTFQSHTEAYCTGTTVLHLAKEAVPKFKFTQPSKAILGSFTNLVSTIFTNINDNIEENKTLEKTRDSLLPKLLNGDILL